MPSRLHIDIETRSRQDLKKVGVHRYVRCPDFKILMASWSLNGSPIRTALTYDDIDQIPGLWDPDVIKVAHNAAFERICFSAFLWDRDIQGQWDWSVDPYLPPEDWHDTMAVAAEQALPLSLEKLATRLKTTPKDSAGTRLISLFCKPNRKSEWNDHTTHPLDWLDFIAYCERDVETLAEVDALLGDFPTEHERQVYFADQRINDRGIRIDLDLARAAAITGAASTAELKQRITDITGGAVVNAKSNPQMRGWLNSRLEETLPNLKAETVNEALRGSLPDDVREVLSIHQELAFAAPAKFSSALACEVDGRLHGMIQFHGAHTGRWAGRRTQVHNLPRLGFTYKVGKKEKHCEVDQQLAIATLLGGGTVLAEDLKRLVRPMFIGPFTVVDYASIEARVIAWLAGEGWVLDAARARRDLYIETADRMGGLTRAQGKIAVLALGFGGGPGSLRVMAGADDDIVLEGELAQQHRNTAAKEGVDPSAPVNVLIRDASDEALYQLFVNPWRDANARIVRLWHHLENAFRAGGPVGPHLRVSGRGNDRIIWLPSGRALHYPDCKYQNRMKYNKRKEKWESRRVMTFRAGSSKREETYGGRLAENVTQAVARDLLAAALVRLEARGYPVVAHVHDEVLVEGEHDVDTLSKIICELPDWAAGLPVDGEGAQMERYRKA